MATTTYTLTCLSPVHIGTGTQFSKFDGVYEDKQWHLVDLDKVIARGVDANELAKSMSDRNFTWDVWLHDKGIAPPNVAAYALPCPQDPEDSPVREAMKDVHQQPYFPGTSVKGAVRTGVLWKLFGDDTDVRVFTQQYLTLATHVTQIADTVEDMAGNNRSASFLPDTHHKAILTTLNVSEQDGETLVRLLYRMLRKDIRRAAQGERSQQVGVRHIRNFQQNPRYVGQPMEREVMGRDPNHDLMRAVQVSDSGPVGSERLAVGLVWTYTLRGNRLIEKREQDGEYKAFVELLMPDTTMQLAIRTDDFLFTDAANRDLHFRGAKEQVVRQLARTCNAYARSIIAAEKTFYAEHELNILREFYADLENVLNGLADSAFLLNIGWGSGWEVKTVGDLLRVTLGQNRFQQLRERYRLGQSPKTHTMDLNALFPKTRRVAYEGSAPKWAMGWIKLIPAGGGPR